jgi:hypothetical protein
MTSNGPTTTDGFAEYSFESRDSKQASLAECYGKLPLSFEINRGQADSDVTFISRGLLLFDLCLQDDSSGNFLQINATTGDLFTNCSGLSIGGTGILTARGNQITLQTNVSDHRVIARIDTSANSKERTSKIFNRPESVNCFL